MTPEEVKHRQLTIVRAQAYAELFGGKPDAFFAAHQLKGAAGGPDFIDVFVYPIEMDRDEREFMQVCGNTG